MITQELVLKFLRHNPALSVLTVEKEASLPKGTLTKAISGERNLNERHLTALLPVFIKYGYSPTLYQHARVISIINHKGGVGKTTTTGSLGEALARKGFNVLLIDMDPQGNLSQILGVDNPQKQVVDALLKPEELPIINIANNLDLSPSDIDLAKAEIELIVSLGGVSRLKNKLVPLMESYDYILIDCPPSLNALTSSALIASKSCLITLQPEISAVKGLNTLLDRISEVRTSWNPAIEIDGIVFTMVKKNSVHDGVKEHVRESMSQFRVFRTEIKHLVDFQKAQIEQSTISKFAENSEAAKLYRDFSEEFIQYLQIVK
ncbi:ParA family protein [Flectobacillus major]|jgi:chromosome partitioning protein|uniref:ParA family protein n=1 Tax=Flectobacillus major TaxID=103 RepID=UPI00041F7F92|nr:AAA family ATPase [Flectobacillus major]